MEKTILDYLTELPDGFRETAIRYMRTENIDEDSIELESYEPPNIADALGSAFRFDNTIEGSAFWTDLYEDLHTNGLLRVRWSIYERFLGTDKYMK